MNFAYLRTFTLGVLLVSQSALATVIDFETGQAGSVISEDGYSLTAQSGTWQHYPVGSNANIPESGSASALLNGGSPASFVLTDSGGAAFDLFNFRVSEGRNIATSFFPTFGATGVTVEGIFDGGGSISTSFNMDVIASDNGATDFELVTLTGFTALTSATFTAFGGASGYSFGIDDINLERASQVPVPATLALLVVGFASAQHRRSKRLKAT